MPITPRPSIGTFPWDDTLRGGSGRDSIGTFPWGGDSGLMGMPKPAASGGGTLGGDPYTKPAPSFGGVLGGDPYTKSPPPLLGPPDPGPPFGGGGGVGGGARPGLPPGMYRDRNGGMHFTRPIQQTSRGVGQGANFLAGRPRAELLRNVFGLSPGGQDVMAGDARAELFSKVFGLGEQQGAPAQFGPAIGPQQQQMGGGIGNRNGFLQALLAHLPALMGQGQGPKARQPALTPEYVNWLKEIRKRREMSAMPLLAKGLGSTRAPQGG